MTFGGMWQGEPVEGVQQLNDDKDRERHGHGAVVLERLAALSIEARVGSGIGALEDFGGALHKVSLGGNELQSSRPTIQQTSCQ